MESNLTIWRKTLPRNRLYDKDTRRRRLSSTTSQSAMTITHVSWYLCLLFFVALAVSSAITVAPGGQVWMRAELATWLALSVLFAVVAVAIRLLHIPQPRWLLRTLQCFAVLATVVVALMVGG